MRDTKTFVTVLLISLAFIPSVCHRLKLVNFRNGNTITFECRDLNNNNYPVSGVVLWRCEGSSNQDLRGCKVVVVSNFDQQFTFTITKEQEGIYFCARSLTDISNGLKMIARPVSNNLSNKSLTFFAKAGTTANIDCSVLPGALPAQYFVDWFKDLTKVGTVLGPRSQDFRLDSRFTVDTKNFSLIISNVSLNDSGQYHCIVGVKEPVEGGREYLYQHTETLNISLIVYDPLLITQPPQEKVTVQDDSQPNQNATFQCVANGNPSPSIKWFHKAAPIDDFNTPGKYSVSTTSIKTPTGVSSVLSVLTINQLTAVDSGEVTCVVMASSEIPVELTLLSASTILMVFPGSNVVRELQYIAISIVMPVGAIVIVGCIVLCLQLYLWKWSRKIRQNSCS